MGLVGQATWVVDSMHTNVVLNATYISNLWSLLLHSTKTFLKVFFSIFIWQSVESDPNIYNMYSLQIIHKSGKERQKSNNIVVPTQQVGTD